MNFEITNINRIKAKGIFESQRIKESERIREKKSYINY